MTRIAVVGASGFVGRALCRHLLVQGHMVVAVTRGASAPVGTIRGAIRGLDDTAGLASALAGADAVVHLAGRVHVMRETSADPWRAFQEGNVEGTRTLLHAACAAGASRFIFMSTAKVQGEGRAEPYRETAPPAPADAYGRSKLEAEELVAESGLDWTILRPPLVYGPGVAGNYLRLLRLADFSARWPLPLGGITNLRSMIYVGNLADAVVASLAHDGAVGQRFLVSDGHDIGFSDLLTKLATAMGRRPKLWRIGTATLSRLGALTGRGADMERMLGTFRVDPALIMQRLGWTPPVALEAGIAATARWWLEARSS